MILSILYSILLTVSLSQGCASLNLPRSTDELSNKHGCDNATIQVRREWGDLSYQERRNYVQAVECLMSTPSEIPKGLGTGARSRYDDYTATHINLTLTSHGDGIFLLWHRQLIWLFHEDLQEHCHYRGPVPYWNWPRWGSNLSTSPLFDGSRGSLGGNGDWDPNGEVPLLNGEPQPRGTGGGCMTTGPFANLTIPFQHFAQNAVFEFNGTLPSDALDYQPRCLKRDLNEKIATRYTNETTVDYLINQSPTLQDLLGVLAVSKDNGWGAHPGGHYTVGPSLWDFFASPADPSFWLHHGMVDLVYTLWQANGVPHRYQELYGGNTTFNIPPATTNTTLDDYMDFGYLGKSIKVGDVMDVTKGPYCYKYDY